MNELAPLVRTSIRNQLLEPVNTGPKSTVRVNSPLVTPTPMFVCVLPNLAATGEGVKQQQPQIIGAIGRSAVVLELALIRERRALSVQLISDGEED